MFDGTVPAELGNLVHLVYLNLNSNNLTGELPKEFSNLINLRELRLSSNNFNGKLPSFQSCKQLRILELEASGFEGPIPSGISLLHNLTEIRITDLNGGASEFPHLENMKALTKLMLRNCNISGPIPIYLANLSLTLLDLSFNRLEGHIPDFEGAIYLQTMEINGCPKHLPCPKKDGYSLHINCGGGQTKIGNTMYVADESQGGPMTWQAAGNWGFSSTGHFWDVNANAAYYQTKNVSVLTMNESQLYTSARLSPLSLTYYGRCLANGNYTVTLHFAEIVFRDNRSFQSLGRRIFNVYIQDELVLKDFDIETVAQGVDKAVVRKFNNTVVKIKTIEIRFYWAGKGTRAVPNRGIYGPLISAISIESNFKPHSDQRKKIVIVVGAVTFSLCLMFTILFIFWRRRHSGSITSREQELRGLDLQTGLFTFRQIKAATNNFDDNNKIGEGGFGSVYKGILLDGTLIAVKQLSSKSKQGNREFVNEIGMISGLQHPNLVRLYGCCIEGNRLLLVYEYMENNSLARALFGPKEWQLNLGWRTRLRICIGIARGLAFLHEESRLKIVHRDIKATNVLLDGDLNPKISDFGLAKLTEDDNTHISTRVAGTIGYMAPEYALWGYLTNKADVYSFGVVALEIAAGKDNMKFRPSDQYVCLLDWALVLQQKGCLIELVDPKLGPDFDKEEAIKMIKIALLCTNPSPALRPAMSAVVSMLEGHLDIQDLVMDPSIYGDEYRFRPLKDKYDELQLQSSNEAQTHTDSMVTTEIGSSSTSTK
ncbi:putative LRR receptor-like serine/threonine-protein kinase [Camellia lanceoleosa]|uniref:LRR receptor-like serine/threonine-protein kinase n=1 Tax=Camellia lanceoleosa TaxID=1840588 RepID=A0ACC0GMS6_9ERIC|nr:putative LRR receptor-like serine/threonine-protein kinase [Camellia lanceoleosa]